MREFIDFVQGLFPSLDEDIASNVYKAIEIELRNKDRSLLEFIRTTNLTQPSQGDLFTNLNLPYVDEDGDLLALENSIGMLLSCGCDYDRDDYVKFAAVHPLDALVEEGLSKQDIKNQTITGFMYLPMFQYEGKEYVVDFTQISSVSTKLLQKLLANGIVNRVSSLNQFGYYFLLAKLSIHFLRPEDAESSTEREIAS